MTGNGQMDVEQILCRCGHPEEVHGRDEGEAQAPRSFCAGGRCLCAHFVPVGRLKWGQ